MFPVSKLMDRAIETQFLKDSSERTVFVPFSLRRNCYFVDEADQDKIRAFVRMYRSLFQIIALLSCPSVFVPALILEDFAGLSPRGHRLAIALGIPLFFWLVLGGLEWILWTLYKGAIPTLTSSLTEVEPEIKEQLRELSQQSRRWPALSVVAGLLLITLGIFAAFASHHFRR